MTLAQTTIDFRTALNLLVSIVKEFGPEHVARDGEQNGCTYFVRDENDFGNLVIDPLNLRPVCIVGQAFHRLGIMRALLSASTDTYTDQHGACGFGHELWDNAEAMGVTFTLDAQRFLRFAQSEQDSGKTWAEAVKNAVTREQEHALNEFRMGSDRFGYEVENALASVPEPLAEWEKELLSAS